MTCVAAGKYYRSAQTPVVFVMLYIPGVLLPVMVRYMKLFVSKFVSGTPPQLAIKQCVHEIESDTYAADGSDASSDAEDDGRLARNGFGRGKGRRQADENVGDGDSGEKQQSAVRRRTSDRSHVSETVNAPGSPKTYNLRRRA